MRITTLLGTAFLLIATTLLRADPFEHPLVANFLLDEIRVAGPVESIEQTAVFLRQQGDTVVESPMGTVMMKFDAAGRRVEQTTIAPVTNKPQAPRTIARDAEGRITGVRYTNFDGSPAGEVTVTRSDDGKTAQAKNVTAAGAEAGGVTLVYDAQGRLTEIHDGPAAAGKPRAVLTYDDKGLKSIGHGVRGAAGDFSSRSTYTFNDKGDVTEEEQSQASSRFDAGKMVSTYQPRELIRYAYEYDAHGNWTKAEISLGKYVDNQPQLKPWKRVMRKITYRTP